jgi:hypothetical protein
MNSETITHFINIVKLIGNDRVVLLKNINVVKWICRDTSFLPEIEKKNKTNDMKKYKQLEDEWGQGILETKRPDLKKHGQWTTKFGEHICEEFCILLGKTPVRPGTKNGYQPDTETEDAIWEAKTQTYFTDGTAGEKILGTPFKYADIPELYGKPLKILCIGQAEHLSRNKYGNLFGDKTSINKQKIIDMYKSMGIEWIGATDLIQQIIANNSL